MQRRALGVLFLVIAFAFGGISYAAVSADAGSARWIIVAAAGALALWMAALSIRALRP